MLAGSHTSPFVSAKISFSLLQGRTFQANIESFLAQNDHLNNVLVEKYQSAKVRRIYENQLKCLKESFPQYVDEIKGMANGARVPFFKVSGNMAVKPFCFLIQALIF